MKKLFLVLGLAAFLFAQNAAQEEVSQADMDQQMKVSDASMRDITPKTLNEFFEEFEDEFGISFNEVKNRIAFYKGESIVQVGESDAAFSKALQLAYEKALLNLQGEYIKDTFGRVAVSKIREVQSDNSTNAREFDAPIGESIYSQFINKLNQLSEAEINKLLAEYGVNPENITIKQRKTLLKDTMTKKTIRSAIGKMTGLVPVRTILTKDKGGNYKIGVVAVMSDKTRQIAKDMSSSRKNLIKGSGKDIKEFLPKEKEGYLNEYGIRLVYAENGEPVILSYGHWGYLPYASNPKKNARLEEIARESAAAQAEAAIVEFINTNIQFNDEREASEENEEFLEKETQLLTGEGNIEEKTVENIIDKTMKKIKSNAAGKIRGIREIKSWDLTSKEGVEHVGAVKAYSYTNYKDTTDSLKPAAAKKPAGKSSNVQRTSKPVNKIHDF